MSSPVLPQALVLEVAGALLLTSFSRHLCVRGRAVWLLGWT